MEPVLQAKLIEALREMNRLTSGWCIWNSARHCLMAHKHVPDDPAAMERAIAARVDEKLKRRLQNAPEAMHWVGPDGTILWANQTELDLLGYSHAEYIGHNIATFHIDRRSIDDILRRLTCGETLRAHPARLRHKNGSDRDVEINSSALFGDAGEFLHTQCFTRDVSHLKQLETAARFLVKLDDAVRPLVDAEAITLTAATALGRHLRVKRCAYATVDEDQDTFVLTGNYTDGVDSIVGRYTFRQFGEECLRLMRVGEPYVVSDSETDPRVTDAERPSYVQTAIRAVICVPILKSGRFVAAMAVHDTAVRQWQRARGRPRAAGGKPMLGVYRARACGTPPHRERAPVSRARELDRQPGMDGAARRLDLLVQRPVVRVHRHHAGTDGRMGVGARPRPGDARRGQNAMEAFDRDRRGVRDGVSAAKRRRRVPPLPDARQSRARLTGRVVHWFGTNTDVETERRATEANALLRERERLAREDAELQKRLLHSLFMQAPTLIAVLRGPDHVVELANPPVCEMWGHDGSRAAQPVRCST